MHQSNLHQYILEKSVFAAATFKGLSLVSSKTE